MRKDRDIGPALNCKFEGVTRMNYLRGLMLAGAIFICPKLAAAGDGATILFKEGHVAYINNGYSALVEEYKKLNRESRPHAIIELKIESSPFLINLSEVVIICRDRCTSLEVSDPRRTKK